MVSAAVADYRIERNGGGGREPQAMTHACPPRPSRGFFAFCGGHNRLRRGVVNAPLVEVPSTNCQCALVAAVG